MVAGFVKLPNALLDDATLPDRALRLWAMIRRRNGEREFRGCYQSATGLDCTMPASARREHRSKTDPMSTASIPWAYKEAQRALVHRGLLVIQRRGPGRSALRWALAPGVHGALELNDLRDRRDISDHLFMETQSRRAGYRPSEGRSTAPAQGGRATTKQSRCQEPLKHEGYPEE